MEDSRFMKALTSCIFGAIIGSIVGLSMQHFSWWLGTFAGIGFAFVFGYFAFEFRQVLGAIPIAWNASWRSCVGLPSNQHAHRFFAMLILWGAIASTIMAIFLPLHLLGIGDNPLAGSLILLGFLMFLAALAAYAREDGYDFTPKDLVKLSFVVSPVVLPFVIAYRGVLGLIYVIPRFPKAILAVLRFTLIFVVAFLRFIHSQLRLMVGVDASIGAAIGLLFFAGPVAVLIGTASGAAFAFTFNYLIISQRILRLELR